MVISFRLWPSVVSYKISSFSLSRQEAVIHFNFPLLPIFIFYYCSPPPQLLFFQLALFQVVLSPFYLTVFQVLFAFVLLTI